MDHAGRRQVRGGAQVHARGRRPRGPQRKAHRHPGPHRSRARAAGRDAAGGEATRRGTEGVRSLAAARAQPLPQLPWFRARRRNGRRSRESRRLLPEALGACEGRRHGATRAGEREEIRATLSRLAGLFRASLLCAAIAAFAPVAAADPSETDPDLATRDNDYAAGKRAVEKKDWAEAAR